MLLTIFPRTVFLRTVFNDTFKWTKNQKKNVFQVYWIDKNPILALLVLGKCWESSAVPDSERETNIHLTASAPSEIWWRNLDGNRSELVFIQSWGGVGLGKHFCKAFQHRKIWKIKWGYCWSLLMIHVYGNHKYLNNVGEIRIFSSSMKRISSFLPKSSLNERLGDAGIK